MGQQTVAQLDCQNLRNTIVLWKTPYYEQNSYMLNIGKSFHISQIVFFFSIQSSLCAQLQAPKYIITNLSEIHNYRKIHQNLAQTINCTYLEMFAIRIFSCQSHDFLVIIKAHM